MKKTKVPPQSRLGRSKVIGTVAAKSVAKKIVSTGKALFLNTEEKQNLHSLTQKEIAELIFSGLSQLRGTALKLAQVFCGETGLLPPEYLQTFEQAHYRVPPLSWPIVRAMVRNEFKLDPEQLFLNFETQSFSAASLGQVHRAQLKSGETVAVKIQYPGMDQTLLSDFSLARKTLSMMRNSGLLQQALNEIEERIKQEIDYNFERKNLEYFRSLELNKKLCFPQAYPQFSGRTVITLDYLEGLHIDEWLRSRPSPNERDEFVQVVFEFFCISVFKNGFIHADPNLGNFLILRDGRIAILDFGAIKRLSAQDVSFYQKLWSVSSEEDIQGLLQEYLARGAHLDMTDKPASEKFFAQVIKPYTSWIQEVLSQETYSFGSDPSFVKRGHEIFATQIFNPALQSFSGDFALLHRTLLGLFTLFAKVNGTITTTSLLTQVGDFAATK